MDIHIHIVCGYIICIIMQHSVKPSNIYEPALDAAAVVGLAAVVAAAHDTAPFAAAVRADLDIDVEAELEVRHLCDTYIFAIYRAIRLPLVYRDIRDHAPYADSLRVSPCTPHGQHTAYHTTHPTHSELKPLGMR